MKTMKIAIASDHAGLALKEILIKQLKSKNIDIIDLGPLTEDSVDYPDYAALVCKEIIELSVDRGILICGTGIGMSIAANRVKGIRAALVHNVETAKYARLHNDANVIVLGSRIIDGETAKNCVEVFLTTNFEGGRHIRRIEKLL